MMMSESSKSIYLKFWRWKLGIYGLAACGIILFNFCMRFILIYLGSPASSSDEGTVGLMAMHIAFHGELPIFFYGQGYMGSLEAFLGAALFPLFGPTLLALRVGVLLLFTLFLVIMYFLTSLLYNKKLALITLALLSLGAPEIFYRESEAQAGHPETPLFCAAILLYTTWLALSAAPQTQPTFRYERKKRLLLYGLWGLLIGVALWNDPLAWTYILLAGIFLVLFCHHELQRSTYIGISLGILVGIAPIIVYNLTAPLTQSTFAVFGILINYNGPPVSSSILLKLAGAILDSLPLATGGNTLCTLHASTAWPLDNLSSYAFHCTIVHGIWGLFVIALWLLAFFVAIRALRKQWYRPLPLTVLFEERKEAILHFARVVMLGGAGLSFIVFTLSAQAVTTPWQNSRYLVVFAVAVPAMFWPLWESVNAIGSQVSWKIIGEKLFIYACLLFFGTTLVVGTVTTFLSVPSTQTVNQQQLMLVDDLLQLHATRIYTDYWTCDLTAFLSREQIICDVLDERLQPGNNRYMPYVSIVNNSPNAAYVFQIGSPQSIAFAKKIAQESQKYRLTIADNYDIYQPIST